MTLIIIEPFEDNFGYTHTTGNAPVTQVGRTGNCVRLTGSSSAVEMRFPSGLLAEYVTIGFAWRTTLNQQSKSSPSIWMVGYDWPTGGSSGNSNVDMIMNVDGSLSVRRGGSAVLGTIPAVAFPLANTWYYVEAQVRVHNTLGFVNVRINGNQVLTTAATLDTLNSTLLCDSVRLGEGGSSAQSLFDDLYIAAGASLDPFLGDCQAEILVPNGNGAVNQFVGSDGDSVNNWQLVDEQPPASADYVQSATPGQQDLYTLSDLALTTGAVQGIVVSSSTMKDEVGSRSMKHLIRRGVTTASPAFGLGDSIFRPATTGWTVDPETGLPWTQANINALQIGVEVV